MVYEQHKGSGQESTAWSFRPLLPLVGIHRIFATWFFYQLLDANQQQQKALHNITNNTSNNNPDGMRDP